MYSLSYSTTWPQIPCTLRTGRVPWALFTSATRASAVGAVPTIAVNLGATSFCSWRQAREGDRKEEEGLRGQRKLVTAWKQTKHRRT